MILNFGCSRFFLEYVIIINSRPYQYCTSVQESKGVEVEVQIYRQYRDIRNGGGQRKCTLPHRSICSHYVNPYFKVSKNSKLKFYMYIQTFYVGTQVFSQKNYVAPIKKTNFDVVTRLRTVYFLPFFTRHTKCRFSTKTCERTYDVTMYTKKINIYIIFLIIFYNWCICTRVPKRHLRRLGVSKLLMAHQIKCCSNNNNNVLMIVTPFHHE